MKRMCVRVYACVSGTEKEREREREREKGREKKREREGNNLHEI